MDMFPWWLDLHCCICDDEEREIDEAEKRGNRKKKETSGRPAAGRRKIIVEIKINLSVSSEK